MPFEGLKQSGILIRRGQLTLIAAGPGSGKSALVQALVQRGDDQGNLNRVFYFSADSDSSVMYKRAAAIATGYSMTDVEYMMRSGDSAGLDAEVNAGTGHIWWNFTSSPTQEEVLENVRAYTTVMGDWPEVIILDNAKNLAAENADEFAALEETMTFLHDLARDSNAAVIALHHVVGNFEDGQTPVPLSGLRGKISKTPEVILTLHRDATHLKVSPVKNRNGKAQATGGWFIPIQADLSAMNFEG